MSNVAEAVTGTLDDLFGGLDAADESPNGPIDAAAEAPQDAALVEMPTLPELPDELAEFLDEPDFDDEPEAELHESDEYVDPDDLARENAKLRKKLEYAESKRVDAEKKKWAAEAEKFFPYADTSEIDASSRRGFLRAARAEHLKVAKKVAPVLQDIEAAKEAARAQAYAEAKAEAAANWGKPNVSGGAAAPVAGVEAADDLERARNSRNLAGVAKALIQGNRI